MAAVMAAAITATDSDHWWDRPPSPGFIKEWGARKTHAGASFVILLLSQNTSGWMKGCMRAVELAARGGSESQLQLQFIVNVAKDAIRGSSHSMDLSVRAIAAGLGLRPTFGMDQAAIRLEALWSPIIDTNLYNTGGHASVHVWPISGPLAAVMFDAARSVTGVGSMGSDSRAAARDNQPCD